MFGIDEREATALQARHIRRRRRYKRLAVDALLLVVLVPLCLVSGGMWLLLTPEGLARLLDYLADDDAPTVITIGDVALDPRGQWNAPDTWGVMLSDLHFAPKDPLRPVLHIDRLVLQAPDLVVLWQRRELHVRQAWLIGLTIDAKVQHTLPPRERRPGALQLLKAEQVHVWDASYQAPADEPLPEAGMAGIFGDLHDVRFDPFLRVLDGHGALSAQRFHTGTLVLDHIQIDEVVAKQSDLVLSGGSVRWEGVRAKFVGTLDNIDQRASVRLEVSLHDAPVEKLISNATGQVSPLYGQADVELVVTSGGDLPRGGGFMTAKVRLGDTLLPLPPDTRGFVKDAIRLAPIMTLDEMDRVHLEHMEGDLSVTRGVVTVYQLLYRSRIPVIVTGTIDGTEMNLLIRAVLGGDPAHNPGIGLRLQGPNARPSVTRATRDELLPGWREIREQERDERHPGRMRLPRLLRRKGAVADPSDRESE